MPVRTHSLTRPRSFQQTHAHIPRTRSLKLHALPSISTPISISKSHYTPTADLPTELLDLIVLLALAPVRAFALIEGFASASARFREVALRQFFAMLNVRSAEDWRSVARFGKMGDWVRTFHTTSRSLSSAPTFLLSFRALHTVRISFRAHTLLTQPPALLSAPARLPPHITRLALTDLAAVDTPALAALAERFARLEQLEVSCAERLDAACCWACYEESASCVCFAPVPDRYATLERLVKALRAALSPLTRLKHLHLGFFLSHGDLLYEHLRHAQLPPSPVPSPPASPTASPSPTASEGPPFGPEWCAACFALHGEAVRGGELDAALALARQLRSLESVGWSTFFGKKREEIVSRRTTVWVCREAGKVKVRRRQW